MIIFFKYKIRNIMADGTGGLSENGGGRYEGDENRFSIP